MICSGSHSSAEMELALTSGPHILRLGALWPPGSVFFGDVDSGRCRTGPVSPSQPRQGHDSWNATLWLIWAGGQWKKTPVVHINTPGCIQSIHVAFNF